MGRFFLLITDNPIVCICIIYFIVNVLIYILYCDYHVNFYRLIEREQPERQEWDKKWDEVSVWKE